MQVLVTGHLGYIGCLLVKLIEDKGWSVTGLDSGLFRDCAVAAVPRVRAIAKDVRDIEQRDIEAFDAVLHLAGLSNDPMGDLDPETTLDINYQGTQRLAELAKRAGVRRFVYASSCSVYGAGGDDVLSEQDAFNPVTPYAKSKVLSEQALQRLADESFCPVYLRAATAYGVSPMIRFDLVLNNLVAWAVATGRIHIKSDGTPWRPLAHAEDIARAYVAMLEAPVEAIHNQAFNVGRNDDNHRVRDIAELVGEALPRAKIEYAAKPDVDRRNYKVDFSKIESLVPGFRPRWTAREGAQQLYDAIERLKLTTRDFEGSRYSRVAHLRHQLEEGRLDGEMRPVVSLSAEPF